ncbi:MAG: PAS domain-containing sensor histidine kinase [Pseudomonadota bacterium]
MHALAKPDTSDRHYLEVELDELIASGDIAWDFLRQKSLDGVWYWNIEDPETGWLSPEFWHLVGIDPTDPDHDPAIWQNIIFPEDLAIEEENFYKHCADPNHAYDQVLRYRHVDGSTVWVRCRGIAIRDENGRPVRMLGAHNDLTAVKRAEQDANLEKARLELANEELTAFAYGVSHDLKSPSRTALQLVEEGLAADEGNLTDEQRELFEGAMQTLTRMQVLVSDLLEYGVLVDHNYVEKEINLKDLMADVIMDLKTVIFEHDASVQVGELPVISGYRSQLRMFVQNMITNAITYRRGGVTPVIKITASCQTGEEVRLHFKDNACGIPEDQLEKIFGVFTRLHRHDDISGSGIGLAVCKRVALNHGATVSVASTLGKGSTFTLHLPKERCISCQTAPTPRQTSKPGPSMTPNSI